MMRWLKAYWIAAVGAVLFCGCRSCERVESELRAREKDVRELKEELDRCHVYSQAMEFELRAIRGEVVGPGPEMPVAIYPVRSLALGRGTGGRESVSGLGDDALQFVLEPRDPENQAIKVPGALLIQAIEVTSSGLKKPLSSWEITPEQLRSSWRTGLLSTGYNLVLPWKVWPTTEKLRIVAQLRLTDGRVFEADKDISVRLAPPMKRVPAQMGPELPEPMPPPPMPVPEKKDRPVLPSPTPEGPTLPEPARYRAPPAGLGTPTPTLIPVRLERPHVRSAVP